MKICPKCSTVNKNPEAHFCYNCGAKLPETKNTKKEPIKNIQAPEKKESIPALSTIKPVEKTLDKPSKQDKISKKWVKFVVGLNILSASFLLVSIGMYFRSNQAKNKIKVSPLTEINSLEIDKQALNQENTENIVLSSKFYSIVPQQPLFYIESSNIQNFLPKVLTEEEISYLEKTYEMPLKDLLAFTSNQFAYVKKEEGVWAVITSPASVDFFERAFSNYQKNKKEEANLVTARIDKYWVFSNDKKYLEDIRSASDNTLLSIGKDSRFTSKIAKSPKNAFFLSYSFSKTYAENNYEEELKKLGMENIYQEVKRMNFKPFVIISKDSKFELLFLEK